MGKKGVGKRPLTPFFMFRGEVYDKVKSDNPEAKQADLSKIIGDMWHKVDADTKNRLETEYAKNQEIFKHGAAAEVKDSDTDDKQEESE